MKKAPELVRGLLHFLAGSVCTSQAEAVRNFLMVISSLARSPIFLVVAVLATAGFVEFVARSRIWCSSSCGSFIAVGSFFGGFAFMVLLIKQTYARRKEVSQLPKIGAGRVPPRPKRVIAPSPSLASQPDGGSSRMIGKTISHYRG